MDSKQNQNALHIKNMHESLIDHIQDYKFYSEESIYKQLHKELLLAYVKKYPECRQVLEQQLPLFNSLQHNFQKLQQRFRHQAIHFTSQLAQAFKKLKTSKDKTEIYLSLSVLKAKFDKIDVIELERLVRKTKQAKELIKDKQVLLIVGTTGSGKTTNILKFLGYNLKKSSINGLSTLVPIQQLSKQHESFKTGPQSASITRYINSAPFPDSMYRVGQSSYKKNFFICDSPGFGDSAGIQVDLANGIGLIDALTGCVTLRVVLLVPYISITADRGTGLKNISQIMSNIFSVIKYFEKSFTVLFNNVPKDMIQNTHNIIEDKMKHIKCEEPVLKILTSILVASENKDNYVYPLENNYKKLFREISEKQPITQMKQLIYRPAAATNTLVGIYITQKITEIRHNFQNNRYPNAEDQLKLLQKLKSILIGNETLNQQYKILCNRIKHEVQTNLSQIQVMISQFFKQGKYRMEMINKIKQRKNKLTSIVNHFNSFLLLSKQKIQQITQVLHPNSSIKYIQQFHKLNDSQKLQMLQKFKKIQEEMDIKQYSDILLGMLQIQFKQEVKRMQMLINDLKSDQFHVPWNKLKILKNQLITIKKNHYCQQQLNNMKKSLQQIFYRNQQYIKQSILDSSLRSNINGTTIKKSKRRLSIMEDIQNLLSIQNKQMKKDLSFCIKNIQNKCNKEIDYIQSQLQQLLQKEITQYTQPFTQNFKQISNTLQKIQLLLTLSDNQHFSIVEKINYKLLELIYTNKDELCNFIQERRRHKIDKNQDSLNWINNNLEVLTKCCEISKVPDKLQQIRREIYADLKSHFEYQRDFAFKVDIRLGSYLQNDLQKIEKNYNKLNLFNKLANNFGQQVKNIIEQINKKFYLRLKRPYEDFINNQLKVLQQKNHYTYIIATLSKFERLCMISFKVHDILDLHQQGIIIQEQARIQKTMKPYLDNFFEEAQQFTYQQISFINQPQNLRDLAKVLLAIKEKNLVVQYLNQKMGLQKLQLLDLFKQKLHEVNNKIEQQLQEIRRHQNQLEQLIILLKFCKFYKSVQDIFRFKQNHNYLHFKQLEDNISKQITFLIDNTIQQVRDELERNANQIDFPKIKMRYQQIQNLKQFEYQRKFSSLKDHLVRFQNKLADNIKNIKRKLFDSDDPIFKDRAKLGQLVQNFNQLIIFQQNMNEFFNNNCETSNQLTKGVKQLAKLWIQVFDDNFNEIIEYLDRFSFDYLDQRIEIFKIIENAIYQIFYFRQQTHIDSVHQEISKGLIQTIEKNQFRLIQEKQKYQQQGHKIVMPLNRSRRKQDRLSEALSISVKSLKDSCEKKYCTQLSNFVSDESFRKYYSYINTSQLSSNKIKKQIANENARRYFNNLKKQYEQKFQSSNQQAQIVQQNFNQSLEYLLQPLKEQYKNLLAKVKQSKKKVEKTTKTEQKTPTKFLINQYIQEYFKCNNNSYLSYFLKKQYGNNEIKLIKDIVKLSAFQNKQSQFYLKLQQQNPMIKEKFIEEIINNSKLNLSFLQKYTPVSAMESLKKVERTIKRRRHKN